MLAVVATAKQFSLRPSELLGIGDEVVALAFDFAAALRVQQEMEEDVHHRDTETRRTYL